MEALVEIREEEDIGLLASVLLHHRGEILIEPYKQRSYMGNALSNALPGSPYLLLRGEEIQDRCRAEAPLMAGHIVKIARYKTRRERL